MPQYNGCAFLYPDLYGGETPTDLLSMGHAGRPLLTARLQACTSRPVPYPHREPILGLRIPVGREPIKPVSAQRPRYQALKMHLGGYRIVRPYPDFCTVAALLGSVFVRVRCITQVKGLSPQSGCLRRPSGRRSPRGRGRPPSGHGNPGTRRSQDGLLVKGRFAQPLDMLAIPSPESQVDQELNSVDINGV